MLTTTINFILYTAVLIMIIKVGRMRPAWRGELFGVFLVIIPRVLFYAISVMEKTGIVDTPYGLTHWLSVFSSMIAGVIMVSYGGWVIHQWKKLGLLTLHTD